MGYGLTLQTAPSVEPLTRAEAKSHIRVVADDDNTLIDNLITAARQYCERHTNRQICTATWDLYLDGFPSCYEPLYVPLAPLASVTSIVYTAPDGTSTTWASSNYIVSTSREPGQITPAYSVAWPTVRSVTDAVRVRFVAGYGLAVSVPMALKQAMLLLIGHWFENREDVIIGTISKRIEMAVEALLESYKVGDEFTCYAPESYATA